MKFVTNVKAVLIHAWSIRLAILTALLSTAEVALPFFTDIIPPRTMAFLAIFTAAGAAVARLIAQPKTVP